MRRHIARALADNSLTVHAAATIHTYPARHNWKLGTFIALVLNVLWEWWSLLAISRSHR